MQSVQTISIEAKKSCPLTFLYVVHTQQREMEDDFLFYSDRLFYLFIYLFIYFLFIYFILSYLFFCGIGAMIQFYFDHRFLSSYKYNDGIKALRTACKMHEAYFIPVGKYDFLE